MNDEALVLHTKDARGVVTLTLNRPQAFNALSEAMIEALDIDHTPLFSVRCLLVYAEPNDGGGARSWMGVEAEVEGPAAMRFVKELRTFVDAYP